MLTEKMIKVYEETREFKALCSVTKEWYTIQQHIEILNVDTSIIITTMENWRLF